MVCLSELSTLKGIYAIVDKQPTVLRHSKPLGKVMGIRISYETSTAKGIITGVLLGIFIGEHRWIESQGKKRAFPRQKNGRITGTATMFGWIKIGVDRTP